MSDFLIELCQMQELLLQFIKVCEKLVHFDRELMQENVFANLFERTHPYHLQRVQALQPTDYSRRVRFCQWVIYQVNDNPNFLSKILFMTKLSFQETVSGTYIICTCGLLKIPTV
ncbi:hypothetical protein BDFB_014170 [Asbolus verrucosus]|uniref:Uncharacterized protein n=1 Tax=Asbolus verrucosus TaxID=1661398 RepID=A0A482W0P3_ASBVE|nr:hypothetical protein BDFB_014170 [Asbolus verrucosus]